MKITADEGYFFGIGVFTTIAMRKKSPVFLPEHLQRLNQSAEYFGICQKVLEEEVFEQAKSCEFDRGVMKIALSGENKVFTFRKNPYGKEAYEKGFSLGISTIIRNETSPFTYHKTFQYGDCILEKRHALLLGFDDMVFCNSRGEVCETTAGNLFFTKGEKLYTPALTCGLLPGILRSYLYKKYEVQEMILHREEIKDFSGCFLTNSLMGIMPVRCLGDVTFTDFSFSNQLYKEYSREMGV